MALGIRKGDMVRVLSGKDKGKEGKVVRSFPAEGRVLVEGVNRVKRHEKIRAGRGRAGTEGGIIEKELPVRLSTVAVVCGSCGKAARLGAEIEDGVKTRVCRRCGAKV